MENTSITICIELSINDSKFNVTAKGRHKFKKRDFTLRHLKINILKTSFSSDFAFLKTAFFLGWDGRGGG